MGMGLQNLTQMGSYHCTGIHHGVAHGLGMITLARFDPDCIQAKCRVFGLIPLQGTENPPWIYRQITINFYLRLTDSYPMQGDAVAVWRQIQIVPDMHRLDQKSKLLRQFLPYSFDTVHQLSSLVAIHQRDKPVTHLQADDIHGLDIFPGQLFRCCHSFRLGLRNRLHNLLFLTLGYQPGPTTCRHRQSEKGKIGHPRDDAHNPQYTSSNGE